MPSRSVPSPPVSVSAATGPLRSGHPGQLFRPTTPAGNPDGIEAFGVSEMLDREHSKVMSEINNFQLDCGR